MKLETARIEYAWYERFIMRCLFAVALYQLVPRSLFLGPITHPNGIGRIIDLNFLLDPYTYAVLHWGFLTALALYVLRLAWAAVLPLLTIFVVLVGTLINSYGAISHYSQIVSLVLCAQTAAYFTAFFNRRNNPHRDEVENRVVFWSQQPIVATYLVSGLTKLIHTSGLWIVQSPKIAVQLIKTTDQDYYDRLDTASYGSGQAIAEWCVHHPLLVALVLGSGLILELTTPLALLGRTWALGYGIALIAFHESVQRVMKLGFPFNEYLPAIYLVNAPYWLRLAYERVVGKISPKN